MKFASMISNLIANSIESKLSDRDLTVSIALTKDDNNIEIRIEDNGKGIPEHVIEKIGQEGFSYNKKFGNGLGVAESKKYTNQLNGSFKISSIENQSTTVIIRLPS